MQRKVREGRGAANYKCISRWVVTTTDICDLAGFEEHAKTDVAAMHHVHCSSDEPK